MPIEYISASDPKWIDYLKISPQATVFHHPNWVNLIADFYGFRSFVAVVRNRGGDILAGIPMIETKGWLGGRRWISLPFTDHCEILYDGDAPSHRLWEGFIEEYQGGVAAIEIRSEVPYPTFGHQGKKQVLHLLKLSSNADAVYKNFHRSQVKRNISKAEREGVTIRWAKNRSDLDVFYKLYVGTRHRLGMPTQPKRYFDLLWERMVDSGFGFILLAEKDALPIAGGVFLTFKDKIIYKYGASDSKYWEYRANHKLFWTAIQWGCINGYTIFDWGKTNVNNTGLREFKKRWGSEEISLIYTTLFKQEGGSLTEKFLPLLKIIIKNTPVFVGKLVGNFFYKYSA